MGFLIILLETCQSVSEFVLSSLETRHWENIQETEYDFFVSFNKTK